MYRSVASCLYRGDDPAELAQVYRDRLGLSSVYLADLDAIEHQQPNVHVLARLGDLGLDVWVDLGIRGAAELEAFAGIKAATVILATETLVGPEVLAAAVARFTSARVVFGLDLRDGRPILAEGSQWVKRRALDLIESALAAGIHRLLLLDLARVGSSRGIGTLPFLRSVRRQFGAVEVAVGGGVTAMSDVAEAARAGASAVLVGSALHDGRIGVGELRRLSI